MVEANVGGIPRACHIWTCHAARVGESCWSAGSSVTGGRNLHLPFWPPG